MVGLSIMMGFFTAFNFNPEVLVLLDKMSNNTKVMFFTIAFFILAIGLFLGVFWLFYRLLYGILLRRLYANYKELKKIDL
jgi:flagellar biogenesis protein FliO